MGLRDFFKKSIRNDSFKSTALIENKMQTAVQRVDEIDPRFKSDGWVNPVTAIGTKGDKKVWGSVSNTVLSTAQLDSIYQSSVLGAALCDIPAYEKLRQGYQIQLTDADNDTAQLDDFKTELQSFDTTQKLTMGEVFGALYGGGAIYIGVDDGLNPWDPLDLSRIRRVEYLTLLDRFELANAGMIDMNVGSSNFARPEFYALATIDPNYAGVRIHHSRFIRFDGIQMSRRRMAIFNYWGQSIINRTYDIIQGYESSQSSIASMIQDFNVLLLKMQNLPQILAGGAVDRKWFEKKIAATTELMSVLHAFVVGDGEEVSHLTRTVTGLPELIDRIVDQVVMASKIPKLLLFGKGATQGQNASADGEVRMFYDYIRSQQINSLQPKIRKLVQVFMASKTGAFAGNIVPFQISFNPLWQLSETEMASIQFQGAQSDNLNIMNGVYSPEEARTRYQNGKYNINISLDEELDDKVSNANRSKTKPCGIDDPNSPSYTPPKQPMITRIPGPMSASEIYPSKKV